ncbi:hypothetical protein [Streptomyces sp. NPDC057616]|uniref:hypothetical protein n=1 Tax=Streptomyces sp. NPDC057616 TaxID=3346183 RepID=UPI00368B3DEE
MISRELEELFATARSLLADDFDLGMMNDVRGGYSGRPLSSDIPADYVDFLIRADGGIFGSVVLFEAKVVVDSQFYADPREGTPVQLNRTQWFCIGKINEDPIFLHRATDEVWGFPDTGVIWWQSEAFEKFTDDLNGFLLEKVFGGGYREIAGEDPDDSWLTVLRQLDRIS